MVQPENYSEITHSMEVKSSAPDGVKAKINTAEKNCAEASWREVGMEHQCLEQRHSLRSLPPWLTLPVS